MHRAALDEALAWGAEAVVVKGDVTALGRMREFATAAELLSSLPVPVEVIPGNSRPATGAADMRAIFRDFGIDVGHDPWSRDLPGIRLVLGLTAIPMRHGEVWPDQRRLIADLLADAPAAAYLALHHYPQRFEWANVYPPGVPASQAGPLLDAVAAANPPPVSSGHTHRHRRHFHGPDRDRRDGLDQGLSGHVDRVRRPRRWHPADHAAGDGAHVHPLDRAHPQGHRRLVGRVVARPPKPPLLHPPWPERWLSSR